MAESEVQRIDRLMEELKQKRRAASKREREQKRREEQRRRLLIDSIITEHADATLMVRINQLLKDYLPIAEFHLWPDLFPAGHSNGPEVNAEAANDNTAPDEPKRMGFQSSCQM
ncbi:MAG: hypothetical protein ETSY1_25995 [Candidatus Entotheonella factor]|uniref:Uncharacterized protein n=1 Tax=Entotheonella factor TaxID=1429438 RepID=W4LF17_ENTF1|nr:MAG: hypothetical protein ETSY1_25995 [Candidatus Entotheonella factor]